MSKFLRLIGNEFIKLLKKKTLVIMTIIVAVVSIGIAALENVDGGMIYYREDDLQGLIDFYSQYVDETDEYGNPTDMSTKARSTILYCNKRIDGNIPSDDWRVTCGLIDEWAMRSVPSAGGSYLRDVDELNRIIDENDLGGYYDWFYLKNSAEYYPQYIEHYEWMVSYCKENAILPVLGDVRYDLAWSTLDLRIRYQRIEETKRLGGVIDEETEMQVKNELAVANYQVEHGITANPLDSFGSVSSGMQGVIFSAAFASGRSVFWNTMSNSAQLITFVGLMTIIIGGGIVASEFSQGTIKFMLINPAKRWKLLMAKYATVLLSGVIFSAVIFVSTFIIGVCFCGFGDAFAPGVAANDGVAYTVSPYLKLLVAYLLEGVDVVLMATLAFAISSLLRSSAASIGIALFVYFTGNIATLILHDLLGFDWARYLLFANTSFLSIVNGTTGFPHHSLVAAIIIVVLHMTVFIWTAIDGFVRREV